MRNELSSLDLKFLANELKVLVGGIIQKAWQEGKQLRFEIFLPSKGTFELLFEPGRIFITEYRRKAPESPGAFAMALRKHLAGQRITAIRQPGFERILEIHTEKTVLILETFSKGNAVICDSAGTIIAPLEVQIWRSRKIAPKVKYQYPPQVADPYSLTVEQFRDLLRSSDKDVVRFLATDLSFSGLYAEEICARVNIDKKTPCKLVSAEQSVKIFTEFHDLLTDINPSIVFDGDIAIDAVPIRMKIYEDKRCEPFSNFTSALDEYFTHRENVAVELGKKAVFQAEAGKLERILDEQKRALANWRRKEKESRKKAEAVYNNFEMVNKIINGLNKAKESGLSWDEIKRKVKAEKTKEAGVIKEIRQNEGRVVLRLRPEVEIDFRKSAQENAEKYFEEAKTASRKLESSKEAIKETQKRMRGLKKQALKEEKPLKPRKRVRGKWYEKFHWMFTSDGFLVIGGRDATQNEVLFKKHLESNDIVLHADIIGAPLTFVKAEGKTVTPLAIREASEFAVAYSTGWKRGLASVDVYWVRANQVSKTAQSGEFLPKGSFVIRGSKNFMKNTELKIAIGVAFETDKEGRVFAKAVCGAVQAVNMRAKYFVTLKPGVYSQQQAAEEIKKRLLLKALPDDQPPIEELDTDELRRLVPAGHSSIIG